MIVATLLGGPHDGVEIAISGDPTMMVRGLYSSLESLVIPYAKGMIGDMSMVRLLYRADVETLKPCPCCRCSAADWAHGVFRTVDTTSIEYTRHWTCTYVFKGEH